MKTVFVRNILESTVGNDVTLLGWISSKRDSGGIVFMEIDDSTGSIQSVLEKQSVSTEVFEAARKCPIESGVRISGQLVASDKAPGGKEIKINDFEVIGAATKRLSPTPRSEIDIFDPHLTDHLLRNRHLYIRNPKLMAVLRFRSEMMRMVHTWFHDNSFVELTAPILTPLPLYEDRTAIPVTVHDEQVFLTQCVGFYLESSVHAFERVYNIGPSFRAEESRSKRHLTEYWHVKGELAFGDIEDIISIVESLIQFLVKALAEPGQVATQILGTSYCEDGLTAPFPRITYREAIELLRKSGMPLEFGKSLGSEEEELLSKEFNKPFWVVGIPRSIEPFPYVINAQDPEVTMTADLIATRGYGELLGVAEKIPTLDMLVERMTEKGKADREEYGWLKEMRESGFVPHIGFGMGVERFIRYLLQIEHVRDTIPFPRLFRRNIYP